MAIEFIHSLEVAGDLTVDGVISKSDGGSSTQWDAAYNWGNHADAGYSTSNTNYYLNGVSFDTGNGQITFTISGAANKTVDIDGRYVISSHKGGGDYFAGHHSEGRLLANAYLSNDLGNARKRGSEFTLTNTSLSESEIDRMFDGLATMAGIPTTDFEAGPVVIEFTVPRTLSYGAYVGIGFGNSTWRCKDVKIEAYSNGAWVTCVHETNNAYEDVYTNIPGNSGVGTTKFRYTLDNPNNNVRICHLWAYNYNSELWSQIMMPRAGGTMYGALTVNGTLNSHTIPSGTGTLALTSDIPSTPTDFVSKASGGTFDGGVVISTSATRPLEIKNTTNGGGAGITFNDNTGGTQKGYITHFHSDSLSYGSGASIILGTTESTFTVLADGKLMYNEGIYSKPTSGTGAGTRKDSNWDTAYSWGDHADAGYGSSSFDGKYSSLTGIPTTFAPSAHNHDSDYLKLTAKASDSEKLDGIDSTGFVKQLGDATHPDYLTPSSRRVNPTTKNPTNEHYAISTFGNDGNVTGQLATHFQTGNLYSRGYNSIWSEWRRYHNSLDFSVTDVANGVTAYGWGDHSTAGYGSSSFDGKYASLTDVPSTFAPSSHNHDTRYLRKDVASKSVAMQTFETDLTNNEDWRNSPISIGERGDVTSTQSADIYAPNLNFHWGGRASKSLWMASNGHLNLGSYSSEGVPDSAGTFKTGTLYAGAQSITATKVSNWNTAHGWGNHADGGYLTSYSETSDLESVRARDNSIGGVINFTPDTGDILQVDGQVILKRTTTNGGITIGHDDAVIIAGGDTSGTLNSNINNAEETVFIGAEGGLKVFAFPDNMSGGWAARKEWRFQNDGDTDFPGKLYPSGGSTHYVDSTRISNWQTAYGWGDHSTRGYLTRSKPESPKILSQIVGETIEVTITASSTSNIDQYLIFSSVVGSDFGLISVIPPDDFAEQMSVIDNSFDEGGKIEYRVYAVKQGVYSDVATTSQDFSVGELEPTNLSVVDLNNAKHIQWDAPSSKKRFVGVYNVYHHEHDTQASLLRSSASLIYSGTNTSYMKPTSNNKFHQFWVEITES